MVDRDWRAEYPFESRFHRLPDGTRMHYLDEGTGDPVLMLHGNPSWSFYYRKLVLGLRGTHRVIVPDHVGCGLSDKPQRYEYRLARHIENLESLTDALGLDRPVTLVVHDWGGAIGMGWAVRAPERVGRLVVFNTAAWLSTRCPWRIRVCRTPLLGALAVRGLNAFAGAAIKMAVARPMAPRVRAGYLAPYDSWASRIATLRFVQDIPLSERHPSHATLARIDEGLGVLADRPMLIGWGMRDWCFDEVFLAEWERRFPGAEVHRVEEAGHYVVEDAGERLLPLIQRFLDA